MELYIILNLTAVILIIYTIIKITKNRIEQISRILGWVFMLAVTDVIGFYIAFVNAYSEGSQEESTVLETISVVTPFYGPSVIAITVCAILALSPRKG